MEIKLYQMDAFLNGYLKEEVYVMQLTGFESFLVDRKSTSGMAHFLGPYLVLGNQEITLSCYVHSRS